MSDLMPTAVLSMPYDMAMAYDLSRRQFYDRAQQALEEIERLTAERDELRLQLAEAEQDARRYRYLRDKCSGEVDDYGTVAIKFRCDFEHYDDLDASIDDAKERA